MIYYDSNNSGGDWWLTDADWKKLEQHGWIIDWKPERWLGALATSAKRDLPTVAMAKAEFAYITNKDPDEDGCECCGPPHYFHSGN